ncbi:MAG: hypothetical protein ACRD3Y_04590 [Bryobacteraceae bacterium]
MKGPFDDPELKEYFRHAEAEMIPKLRGSALSLTILGGNIDPKLCCELGAAILLDKPLIILVPDKEAKVPANLKRVATRIIFGAPSDPGIFEEIEAAIRDVAKNDQRAQ